MFERKTSSGKLTISPTVRRREVEKSKKAAMIFLTNHMMDRQFHGRKGRDNFREKSYKAQSDPESMPKLWSVSERN